MIDGSRASSRSVSRKGVLITHEAQLPTVGPRARLASVVPRPRADVTRNHGVFAPNFKYCHRIIPNPVHESTREPHAPRAAPKRWMQRLKRVFHIDIELCGVCGGTLRVIACIETPELIKKILTHLAARETRGINHPRAPPHHAPQAQPPNCRKRCERSTFLLTR